jgi:hypothetical protein
MEMKRRQFVQWIAKGSVILALPSGWLVKRCVRFQKYVAPRPPVYPGPVAEIDPDSVQSPATWAG